MVRRRASYAPALNTGFQATAASAQEMHQVISAKVFESLAQVPGLSVPTRVVQGMHDAITQGVYTAVRHGGNVALSMLSDAEQLAIDPQRVIGTREQALRSALNGVFGDSLAAHGNDLAISMSLHANGVPLQPGEPLASLRQRVCVFIHGLACDEQSWALRSDAWSRTPWADSVPKGRALQYGELLQHELDVSAVYLRYNSGLSIDGNSQQLAELLERLAQAAPQVVDWVLVGHSMGGLVARRAHEFAAIQGLQWAIRTSMIVCLGSPHQGASLEKLGHVAAEALALSDITRPIARVANARSRGIKDLRRGLKGKRRASPSSPALRLAFATLGDEAAGVGGSFVGKMFGDGLVMPGSASDHGHEGDVERVQIAGLGHMSLLNHPRVYAVLRRWLGAPGG
jgi:pimeloyl-ACP methyl ester carboxylesterase